MKRSKQSLSHYNLTTGDMGQLIPLTWYEALPGDTIQQRTNLLIRVSPLNTPVMHPVRVRLHHFFVPNRIIWDDWEDFITGGEAGTSTPTHPYFNIGSTSQGELWNYFGLPVGTYGATLAANALPFRAYATIFNEFYRDQQLVTALTVDTTSGQDTTTNTVVQDRDWETKIIPKLTL